eukprot:c34061_g1_i1.p1 GENE.c34061_g1_i1~~c34061_g1_i1.p1  ORF type:complete len:632 (-),score=246.65 c34061_g1_i1:28-1923(-)
MGEMKKSKSFLFLFAFLLNWINIFEISKHGIDCVPVINTESLKEKKVAIIGKIDSMKEKEMPVVWGTSWMGDKGKYNNTIELPRVTPKLDDRYPISPNDPGPYFWNVNLQGREEIFMKNFGYIRETWARDEPLTAAESNLLKWVEREGLKSPCATIAHFDHPNFVNRTLRGIVANCSIGANKPVMTVPTKLIITPHRLLNSPIYDKIAEYIKSDSDISFDYDHLMLVMFLVLERQDPTSFWKPYFETLPEQVLVPSESDDYGRLWLDASYTVKKSEQRLKVIDWQFDHLSKMFKNQAHLLPRGHHFNKKYFSWAYNVVSSRSFVLDFGVHKDALCLVPFADFMNHDNMVNVGWLFQGKVALSFYSSNEIYNGQQILNHYGDFGNDILSLDYGFVMNDNPFTCAYINLLPISSDDQFGKRRLALLQSQNLEPEGSICVMAGPPSSDLFYAAVVMIANGELLNKNISPENLLKYLTDDIVHQALIYIRNLIQIKLKQYQYLPSLDERLLPLLQNTANSQIGDTLSVQRFDSVFLRYEEKWILNSTLRFINVSLSYQCNTLPPTFQGADDTVFEIRSSKSCSKYLTKVIIPLLQDLFWENSLKYVKPRRRKAFFEDWNFVQNKSRPDAMPINKP